jgi:hypothetical protein
MGFSASCQNNDQMIRLVRFWIQRPALPQDGNRTGVIGLESIAELTSWSRCAANHVWATVLRGRGSVWSVEQRIVHFTRSGAGMAAPPQLRPFPWPFHFRAGETIGSIFSSHAVRSFMRIGLGKRRQPKGDGTRLVSVGPFQRPSPRLRSSGRSETNSE